MGHRGRTSGQRQRQRTATDGSIRNRGSVSASDRDRWQHQRPELRVIAMSAIGSDISMLNVERSALGLQLGFPSFLGTGTGSGSGPGTDSGLAKSLY